MAKKKYTSQQELQDSWNDIVLSLATGGGYIVSDGKMAEIHIGCLKMNLNTLLLEHKFLTYWMEEKKLHELYSDVYIQQDELRAHEEDKAEQEKIRKEREAALLFLKKSRNKKKPSKIIVEDIPDETVDDSEDAQEHDCD